MVKFLKFTFNKKILSKIVAIGQYLLFQLLQVIL